MRDTSDIEIDLSAIATNVAAIRGLLAPGAGICGVIKSDAYGLGAVRVARTLRSAGVGMLAVYTPAEAAELAAAAVGGLILVLMPVQEVARGDDFYRLLVSGRLHLALHDADHLVTLRRIASRFGTDLALHLEIDTGLHRGGCDPSDAASIAAAVAATRHLRLAGIFTHYARSENDPVATALQTERFDAAIAACAPHLPKGCLVHSANTCAAIRDPATHRSLVRVGQGWAGYGVERVTRGVPLAGAEALQPALRWSSRIVQVKRVRKGETIGYGGLWTAPSDRMVALVPVGYADGYPLALSGRDDRESRAMVAITGAADDADAPRGHAPVVGVISMDQMVLDVTDLVAGPDRLPQGVAIGSRVELISPDRAAPNHLSRLAEIAATNPLELLCRMHPGIRRTYVRPVVPRTPPVPRPATAPVALVP